MGINRRNADYVLKYNKRSLYPIVDDKIITSAPSRPASMCRRCTGDLHREGNRQARRDHRRRNDFVIKPAQGAGGDGILVIADRFEGAFARCRARSSATRRSSTRSPASSPACTLGGHRDRALIEYRVTPDQIFKSISYEGVPDIRIIVLMGYPVMAMLRLPTRQSGGKANLHQGAIGVGVDLATGLTLRGTWLNNIITKHPDTTNAVDGVQLPYWDGFMKLAAGCYELCGLGYIGVDMVLDQERPADPRTECAAGAEYPDRQRLRADPAHPCGGGAPGRVARQGVQKPRKSACASPRNCSATCHPEL
jgi:alpha-L-glutamate ligase-like protein